MVRVVVVGLALAQLDVDVDGGQFGWAGNAGHAAIVAAGRAFPKTAVAVAEGVGLRVGVVADAGHAVW